MITPPCIALFSLGAPELFIVTGILGMLFVFMAIPAILAFVVLSRIPPQYRKQEPAMAFLLLIPFFALIWNFFVHPKVAESLRAYFAAQGGETHGDCGGSLALWICICCIGGLVPFFGIFAGLAALVLLIVFYIKAFELSARIGK